MNAKAVYLFIVPLVIISMVFGLGGCNVTLEWRNVSAEENFSTPTATDDPNATPVAIPTRTPKGTQQSTFTSTLSATPTETPTSTATATVTPTPTPSDTPTITPTEVPHMSFLKADKFSSSCWGYAGIDQVYYDSAGITLDLEGNNPDVKININNTEDFTTTIFVFDPAVTTKSPQFTVSRGLFLSLFVDGLDDEHTGEFNFTNVLYMIPTTPGILCAHDDPAWWKKRYDALPFSFWVYLNVKTGQVSRYSKDRYRFKTDEELCNIVKNAPPVSVNYGFYGEEIFSLTEHCPSITFK